jgi:hypothetical protein
MVILIALFGGFQVPPCSAPNKQAQTAWSGKSLVPGPRAPEGRGGHGWPGHVIALNPI